MTIGWLFPVRDTLSNLPTSQDLSGKIYGIYGIIFVSRAAFAADKLIQSHTRKSYDFFILTFLKFCSVFRFYNLMRWYEKETVQKVESNFLYFSRAEFLNTDGNKF